MQEIVIVKLGGSVITDKTALCFFDAKNTLRLAEEIKTSRFFPIIVHGTGSFGKGVLLEHNLPPDDVTFLGQEHLDVVTEFKQKVRELNSRVVAVFTSVGLKVVSIPGDSLFVFRDGAFGNRELVMHDTSLKRQIERRIIPISYGDMVVDYRDRKHDFYACSSDIMVATMAAYLRPEKVIFLTDVDGVYMQPSPWDIPIFIKEINNSIFALLKERISFLEVIGEMRDKVYYALKAANYCNECIIVNGRKPGFLQTALTGGEVIGTRILRDCESVAYDYI
jgi:isopentenyl phosphate kinase